MEKEYVQIADEGTIALAEGMLLKLWKEYDRLYWNKNQKEAPNPLENTGCDYENETFALRAYRWDESDEDVPNFEADGIRIYWYKRMGRGMSVYIRMGLESGAHLAMTLKRCLDALRKDFNNGEE